ncbi:DUF397 domain-containing protein [Streptomyces sp. NPDC058297]
MMRSPDLSTAVGPALVFGMGAWAAFVGDVREPR